MFSFFSITKLLGQPVAASKHGGEIDHMNEVVHWFMFVLFVGWSAFFLYVLLRFNRRRSPKASYAGITSHFPTHLEMLVILVETVLLLGFAFPLWSQRVDAVPANSDPRVVKIRAVAEQFRWTFHYAGMDGRFGLVRPDQISGSNPVGLVREDPNSSDDFFANELMLPKDRPVVILVTSKDVIHSLALVPMRVAQDAIPGMEIPVWFVPNREGTWDVVCAQLCGSGHANMAALLKCVKPEEFDSWFTQRSEAAAKANTAATGSKTVT
jgi:cytochrome c oxidase subunit II